MRKPFVISKYFEREKIFRCVLIMNYREAVIFETVAIENTIEEEVTRFERVHRNVAEGYIAFHRLR